MPDIFLPDQKELHFFDEKLDFSNYQGLGNPDQRVCHDMNSSASWRWYHRQFKTNERYKSVTVKPFLGEKNGSAFGTEKGHILSACFTNSQARIVALLAIRNESPYLVRRINTTP